MFQNKAYRLAYDFHEKCSPFPADAEGWKQIGLEAAAVCHLHENNPFLTDLLIAVMDGIGWEYESRKIGKLRHALSGPLFFVRRYDIF